MRPTRPAMRRVVALLIAAGLLASLPVAASAGRALRVQEQTLEAGCNVEDAAWQAGTFAFLTSRGDPYGELFAWAVPVDEEAPPDYLADGSVPPMVVSWSGYDATLELPVTDGTGAPAGTATVAYDLEAVGDPIPLETRDHTSNAWFIETGTGWELEGTATIGLPDGSSIEASCFGFARDVRIFETDPSSRIRQDDRVQLECALVGPDEQTLDLGIDLAADGGDGFIFGTVGLTGEPLAGLDGQGAVDGASIEGTATMHDPFTGEQLGTAALDATLSPTGERETIVMPYTNGPIRLTFDYQAVDGTFTVMPDTGDPVVFDLTDCVAAAVHIKDQLHAANGPKPKGKAVPNDTPDTAQPLDVGDQARVMTRTAAPAPEAPSEDCLGFDLVGTVWYSVTAESDGPLTIDTAGSDFDTALAVYAADGSLDPIPGACNDDVGVPPFGRLIQAQVTFEAVAGTTYLVQVGSFPGDGQLYGKLIIAVR